MMNQSVFIGFSILSLFSYIYLYIIQAMVYERSDHERSEHERSDYERSDIERSVQEGTDMYRVI
jgi:hypothetical protein